MARKFLVLLKKRAAEALITLLLLLVIAIYGHALRQQNGMNERLRETEIGCSTNAANITSFQKALDDRTEAMQRELDQRTGEMQKQLEGVSSKIESEVDSLERLVTTLIAVMKDNGVNIQKEEH